VSGKHGLAAHATQTAPASSRPWSAAVFRRFESVKKRRGSAALQDASARLASSPASSAFTLIEILLVLAIAGMMTAVIAVGYAKLSDNKPATPDDVFWLAVTAARRQALLTGREVRLAYLPSDTANGADTPSGLDMTWDNPNAPDTPGERQFLFEKMGGVILEFLSTQKGAQTVLIGGEAVETQTIPSMTFYGDGTCTPVRIQIRRNAGTAYTLSIDPWTCAQMLIPDTAQQ